MRDEAVEALCPQPRGKGVEPRALGLGEQRSGDVDAHERRTLHRRELEPRGEPTPGSAEPMRPSWASMIWRETTGKIVVFNAVPLQHYLRDEHGVGIAPTAPGEGTIPGVPLEQPGLHHDFSCRRSRSSSN